MSPTNTKHKQGGLQLPGYLILWDTHLRRNELNDWIRAEMSSPRRGFVLLTDKTLTSTLEYKL